jgi:hypothetical protein
MSSEKSNLTVGVLVIGVGIAALMAQRTRINARHARLPAKPNPIAVPQAPSPAEVLPPASTLATVSPGDEPNEISEPVVKETPDRPVGRAKSYFGAPPAGFPVPKKGAYVLVGTPEKPALRGPDGRSHALAVGPKSLTKSDYVLSLIQENSIKERLKDATYRKTLEDAGFRAESFSGAFLFPAPGLLQSFFSQMLELLPIGNAEAGFAQEWVSLRDINTPNKNDQELPTSPVFSVVAAVESAYIRDFGLKNLDLSEQFAGSLERTALVAWPKLKQEEPENKGTFGTLLNRQWGGQLEYQNVGVAEALKRYSIPLESNAPYFDEAYYFSKGYANTGEIFTSIVTPVEQEAFNRQAATQQIVDKLEYDEKFIPAITRKNAPYRIKKWTAIETDSLPIEKSASLFESYLRTNRSISVNVDALHWSFDDQGVLQFDPSKKEEKNSAMASLLLVGFARVSETDWKQNQFLAKHSGGPFYLTLSYDLVLKHMDSPLVVESVVDPTAGTPTATKWLGNWNFDANGFRGRMTVHRVDTSGKVFRMGTLYPDGGKQKTLNAKATNRGRTLEFRVFDDTTVDPNKFDGLPYTLHQYSWDPDHASGFSGSNKNRDVGLHASRADLPTRVTAGATSLTDPASWKGVWAINLDGWTGDVRIESVDSKGRVSGTYTAANLSPTPLTGKVNLKTPYLIDLRYDRKSLQLVLFTGERGLAAGATTSKKGPYYGVHAVYKSGL